MSKEDHNTTFKGKNQKVWSYNQHVEQSKIKQKSSNDDNDDYHINYSSNDMSSKLLLLEERKSSTDENEIKNDLPQRQQPTRQQSTETHDHNHNRGTDRIQNTTTNYH